jgi:hypothetical protein
MNEFVSRKGGLFLFDQVDRREGKNVCDRLR